MRKIKEETASTEENTTEITEHVRKKKKLTAVTCAIVLLAILALNIAVSVWGELQMVFVDLTLTKYKSSEFGMYTLSEKCSTLVNEQAVPMIDKINSERTAKGSDPIKLKIVFCSDKDIIENDGRMRYVSFTARSLAKEFPDRVEVEYINISDNPSAVQKYKTTSAATIYDSDVIVEFGSEYLVQSINSFYLTDSDTSQIWAYNGEKKLASMILAVTRADAPICCITSNHGETLFETDGTVKQEYQTFITLIGGAGYDVKMIDLENENIPENCRLIITFDPREDFKAYGNLGENGVSEIEKLDKYLDEANAFFYICDNKTPVLKNLEEYLEEWGIAVNRVENAAGIIENYSVQDMENCTDSGTGNIVVGNYATEGIGASLTTDLRGRVYPPRVIFGNSTCIKPAANYEKYYVDANEETGTAAYSYNVYYKNGNNRSMMDVFTTHNTASALVNGETYEVSTDINPFKLMTVTQETRHIQEDSLTTINKASYVIALSSTDFLSNDILNSTAYGNTDVLLSTLRYTGNEVVPTNVDIKALYVYDMVDNAAYSSNNVTAWVNCLTVIPAVLAFGIGIVVNVRRKHR